MTCSSGASGEADNPKEEAGDAVSGGVITVPGRRERRNRSNGFYLSQCGKELRNLKVVERNAERMQSLRKEKGLLNPSRYMNNA